MPCPLPEPALERPFRRAVWRVTHCTKPTTPLARLPCHLLRPVQLVAFDEGRHRSPVDSENARNGTVRDTLCQQLPDHLLFPGELGLFGVAPLRPAQPLPFALLPRQRHRRATAWHVVLRLLG